MIRGGRYLSALILLAFVLIACQSRLIFSNSRVEGEAITVAAASDLQYAYGEIGELFEKETGRKVNFNFGSTGNLAKQIENGAPIDVFAAADVKTVDDLRAKGIVSGDSQKVYAVGRIVLASNKRSGLVVRDLADLARPEVKKIAIANPEHAPYGAAAKQALEAAGLWDQVKPKLVYGENIRQAMQYVQTGNAEAGIIALAIVAGASELEYVPIDMSLYAPIKQSMAIVARSKREETAREFIAFVGGPKGWPIMAKYGFLSPEGSGQ